MVSECEPITGGTNGKRSLVLATSRPRAEHYSWVTLLIPCNTQNTSDENSLYNSNWRRG